MAAGEFYTGKNLRLSLAGQTLFHATSCGLSISSDNEEISTKDTNGKNIIPGGYSGSLTTDCLIADKSGTENDAWDMVQNQLSNTKITFEFTTGTTGDRTISGECYVTQSDITAEENGIATGSFSFITTGDITLGTVV